MSTVPTPITIYQKVYVEGADDAHGNPIESWDDPVARKVQSINEFGRRGSSHEIVSPDYLNRVETMLELGVPDVTLYKPKDIVLIGPDYAGSATEGVAFHVEGDPSENRLGPFPLLNRILGGAVRVRRVT
jgi:hypothetical protein